MAMRKRKRSAKTGRRGVVCAALALCLCGCQVPRPELPVVGEKKTESRAGGGYGTEGGAAEKGENPGGEMGWKDAPSSYAPQVRTETIRLAGEGEVQVPQEAALPAYRVVNEPYSEAEYGRYKEIVREIYGISWKEGERDAQGEFSGDGMYYLSFPFTDVSKDKTAILWIDRMDPNLTFAGDGEYQPDEGFRLLVSQGEAGTEEEREMLRQRLEEKSEAFIRRLSEEELCSGAFVRDEVRWLGIRTRNETTGKWEQGRYGLELVYERTCGNVPVPGREPTLMGKPGSAIQYIGFVYADDGTLLELKNIGRQSLEADGGRNGAEETGEAAFILPFDAAAQIFEQYVRTYDDTRRALPAGGFAESAAAGDGAGTVTAIRFTRAALEYRYVPAAEEEGAEEGGFLRPVWNFYGTASVGQTRAGERSLEGEITPVANGREIILVSVDAADGSIF